MIDFSPVLKREVSLQDFAKQFSHADLQSVTTEVFDTVLAGLTDVQDADVTFVPKDEQATDNEEGKGWTLGHIVAHFTSSVEESASHASSLARGIVPEGRSHAEVPWEQIQTATQLRARLNESKRMALAFLNTWPDEPHLDVMMTPIPMFGPMNAVARYLLGIIHMQMHQEQLLETVKQAKLAKTQ